MSIPHYTFHFSSTLWQAIYPTQWSRGNWSFDYASPDLDNDLHSLDSSTESVISSSSTVDETNSDSTTDRRGIYIVMLCQSLF